MADFRQIMSGLVYRLDRRSNLPEDCNLGALSACPLRFTTLLYIAGLLGRGLPGVAIHVIFEQLRPKEPFILYEGR